MRRARSLAFEAFSCHVDPLVSSFRLEEIRKDCNRFVDVTAAQPLYWLALGLPSDSFRTIRRQL
jgi:hypothetical protein